uniref:Si:ch211-106h11.3 n=1 Tax=Sinocyclocheilus rhinocerous TaxID=307959 RepID=A0A673NKQ6_9TELE
LFWMRLNPKKIAMAIVLFYDSLTIVRARCPKVCKCPAERPVCPPGVSAVPDGCSCCKVCAAQLNDDCHEGKPCDHHKGLECNYGNDVASIHGICRAKLEGRSCEYNGRMYQNGENFHAGCKHQCTCIDGAVGCVPLCPTDIPLASPSCPSPRLVKIPGQCCLSVDCHGESSVLPPQAGRQCVAQTTSWTPCSRSCGMGVSSRVTNENAQCKLLKETRLCNIRPCSSVAVPIKKGRKCSRTQKSPEPLRLRYAGCRSTRLYRPNYCGTCLDGRCCSPRRTRTAPVLFACPDGEHFERAVMFVQSCKCNDECGHLNDAALPPQRWLYGDMHKFVD